MLAFHCYDKIPGRYKLVNDVMSYFGGSSPWTLGFFCYWRFVVYYIMAGGNTAEQSFSLSSKEREAGIEKEKGDRERGWRNRRTLGLRAKSIFQGHAPSVSTSSH